MRIEHIGDATLYTGDVREALRALSAESVNCIVTSPPYWGLRDYGVPGQIGLEPTPEEYTAKMVEVFAEVRRVLRADGTCWINLGDSYAGGGRAGSNPEYMGKHKMFGKSGWDPGIFGLPQPVPAGLKPKDLVGIPWMVAFALRAEGWYLRSDIIFAKKNPMPESVTDRPTKSHEYVFLLTKSARYWYDAEAIKEPQSPHTLGAFKNGRRPRNPKSLGNPEDIKAGKTKQAMWNDMECMADVGGRNRRTVWNIATQPFPGHFATFPEKLVEPCILAGCPAQTCPGCGAPWERVVERTSGTRAPTAGKVSQVTDPQFSGRRMAENTAGARMAGGNHDNPFPPSITLGHRPTCGCGREDTVPGVVLDPFCGSGTALLVALRLGRRAVGIELKPEYMAMTPKRIAEEAAQVKLCL